MENKTKISLERADYPEQVGVSSREIAELIKDFKENNIEVHSIMILRQGKIYAAGCILPLTQGNALSKSLGTRHRAAVGMSENSDAVIVVVSEETGTISLAVNGELRRGFDAITLHNELNELLIDEKEATTSFLSHFMGLFNKKGTKEEVKDSQETVAEENKDEE